MNILFVCKYNRFRSVLSEAIFKKLTGDKSLRAKSRGIFRGSPINTMVKRFAKHKGIKIKKNPQNISSSFLTWPDVIVIVADDVPPTIFRDTIKCQKARIITWKIKDIDDAQARLIKKTYKMLKLRILALIKKLSKKQLNYPKRPLKW